MLRLIVLFGSLALVMAGNVFGQEYPTRPIRLIVPFPPGGNVDVFSRVLFRQVELELARTS